MSNSLGIIIPDYKSPFLDDVIKNALSLSPEKIVVSNFKTPETVLLQNKYSRIENIQFLNFEERRNPGDYRNEGVLRCFSKNLLFLDSDIRINLNSINFINRLLEKGIEDDKIYWGIYSKFSQGIFSRIQNKILRYRFSNKFFKESLNDNKLYCGQSSHFIITRKTFNKVYRQKV